MIRLIFAIASYVAVSAAHGAFARPVSDIDLKQSIDSANAIVLGDVQKLTVTNTGNLATIRILRSLKGANFSTAQLNLRLPAASIGPYAPFSVQTKDAIMLVQPAVAPVAMGLTGLFFLKQGVPGEFVSLSAQFPYLPATSNAAKRGRLAVQETDVSSKVASILVGNFISAQLQDAGMELHACALPACQRNSVQTIYFDTYMSLLTLPHEVLPPILAQGLRDTHEHVARGWIIALLLQCHDLSLLPEAASALMNPTPTSTYPVYELASALGSANFLPGDVHNKTELHALVTLLGSHNEEVRVGAATALGDIRSATSIGAVVYALNDASLEVRTRAMRGVCSYTHNCPPDAVKRFVRPDGHPALMAYLGANHLLN